MPISKPTKRKPLWKVRFQMEVTTEYPLVIFVRADDEVSAERAAVGRVELMTPHEILSVHTPVKARVPKVK